MGFNKLKKWRKGKSRKEKIIVKADCSIKHTFTKGDLAKAALSFDLTKKLKCIICKKWLSYGDMLQFVMDKEGIDLNDKKDLFKRYDKILDEKDNKTL